MTRTFHAMALGDWRYALANCPLGVVLYFGLVTWLSVALAGLVFRRRLTWVGVPGWTARRLWLLVALGVGLAGLNWGYRLACGYDRGSASPTHRGESAWVGVPMGTTGAGHATMRIAVP